MKLTKAFVITLEPDGLIAYYPFNGNANDESGNQHNGTVLGPVLTTDRFGTNSSAYYFDGTNDKIQIGTGLNLINNTDKLTFTAWINPEEILDGKQHYILGEREGGNNYQFVILDHRLYFTYWKGGVEHSYTGLEIFSNQWSFVAVTYDGLYVNMYINGELAESAGGSGKIDSNNSTLIFGTDGPFNGKLDDISIYNKALSAEKIKSLYTCPPAQGGKVTGVSTICPKTSTGILTLSGNTGNVMEWQKKSGTGPWVSIPATTQTYSEIPGTAGTYYYRTVTQSGACDIKYSEPDTVTVKAVELGISQANNVLTANATPATYQWINCATHTPIAGQTSQSYTATVNGSYAVKITQNGCTDTSACVSLINPFPDNGGIISGAATVCQGQNSVTYTVPVIANATTYLWTLPTGATGTSTTNSITVNYGVSAVGGNITVKGHNATGDGAASTLAITVNPLPAAAGTITGTATICPGQNSVSYSVPAIANATSYIWTLPTGATGTSTTNSISVNYGISAASGNITVKGHNNCGDGVTSTFAVTVNPLPVIAGTITGITTVCQGQKAVGYTVPAITNATTYIWNIPSGATGTSTTNSITVNYGTSAVSGNITVKGHNDCGDGIVSTLAVTVNPLPAGAGVITGITAVCQGQNLVSYTVPSINKATSYIWTLPAGATGTRKKNS